jgi:hypothetical protein
VAKEKILPESFGTSASASFVIVKYPVSGQYGVIKHVFPFVCDGAEELPTTNTLTRETTVV